MHIKYYLTITCVLLGLRYELFVFHVVLVLPLCVFSVVLLHPYSSKAGDCDQHPKYKGIVDGNLRV